MGSLKKLANASLLLRVGLAVVFLYAATSSFVNPQEWVGYLPAFVNEHLRPLLLLKFFSAYELLLAAWLLSGVYVRYAALLTATTLAGIVMSNLTIFVVTFRDIALIFAALALAALEKDAVKPQKTEK